MLCYWSVEHRHVALALHTWYIPTAAKHLAWSALGLICRYFDLSFCILSDILGFLAPCFNVIESSYFGIKGQFDLGFSLNLWVVKGGVTWSFQVRVSHSVSCHQHTGHPMGYTAMYAWLDFIIKAEQQALYCSHIQQATDCSVVQHLEPVPCRVYPWCCTS